MNATNANLLKILSNQWIPKLATWCWLPDLEWSLQFLHWRRPHRTKAWSLQDRNLDLPKALKQPAKWSLVYHQKACRDSILSNIEFDHCIGKCIQDMATHRISFKIECLQFWGRAAKNNRKRHPASQRNGSAISNLQFLKREIHIQCLTNAKTVSFEIDRYR